MADTSSGNLQPSRSRLAQRWGGPAAILAGLATLLMLVLTLLPILVPNRRQQMLAEIDALVLQKKWSEAEQLCRSRLKEYPDSAELALRLGNCLAMQRQYDQARAIFDAAIAKYPSNQRLARDRALLEYRTGNLDEALQRLQKVAKEATYLPIVNYHIGRIYEKKGLYDKALEAYVAELNIGTSPAAWTRYILLKKVYGVTAARPTDKAAPARDEGPICESPSLPTASAGSGP